MDTGKYMNRWHIYPENDLRPHETEGDKCECNPQVKHEEGFVMIIHNAFDKREKLEAYNLGRINEN